ncbi:TIGR02281 family clan AA aspartic protease [Altererythrobacter soli]|uniref:TIGR02281 family clan AA aspartic protease n=1 Tax=Croceibacterium soli TaxID=1739690 RepID=A0A6I4UPH1_9SPHN|nr:TIGR02281 family clan AA aspartic protease [Croceibacterium soli]MXP40638.1 TIGR02281 family clan AA aspartic protease [Croceibacterium soli]
MKALLPIVLIIGALIGWFAPDGPEASEGARPARAPAPEARPAARPAWRGGPLVLPRAGDGHFYADVRVDTRDYRMLVDTGASVVALTGEDARGMGLHWDPSALAPVAHGASGPVLGVPVVLDSVAVGDFEARSVQAVIVPEGLPVSLLGQTFLSSVPNVRISGDDLTLAN